MYMALILRKDGSRTKRSSPRFAAIMIEVGNYERMIAAMEKHPRERVRIVPRSVYEDHVGVDWTTST